MAAPTVPRKSRRPTGTVEVQPPYNLDWRQNGSMEFERARRDLYRKAPADFTAARDAMASEARQGGDSALATKLKKLRKPSMGAWLANVLVLEQLDDVERLVDLGAQLRTPKRELDGEQIRRVSKEKSDAVAKLVRDAKSRASVAGLSCSAAASGELEATLEAAFADPQAAESLLRGSLSSGLRYTGLGFGAQLNAPAPTGTKGSSSPRRAGSDAARIAERDLEKAHREAERAEGELETARRAATDAAKALTRLQAAEALAERRSQSARARESAAKEKLGKLRHR